MIIDRRKVRLGFTLPEATLALVILGMAAAGVLLPFSSGASVQSEGVHRTMAAKLANDLMEQIVSTPCDQIIARWNGYAETQGQVKDASGVVFTDSMYDGYSRDVVCDYVYVPQQSGPPLAPNFVLISVRVYDRGRQVVALSRLMGE